MLDMPYMPFYDQFDCPEMAEMANHIFHLINFLPKLRCKHVIFFPMYSMFVISCLSNYDSQITTLLEIVGR